jgi:serine/threonine-protein kinase RsbW
METLTATRATTEALRVEADLDQLEQVRHFVTAASQTANLDKSTTYKLRVAVDEIANNIITHGYPALGTAGFIEVQAIFNDTGLSIQLEDTAIAYDPYDTLEPDINLPTDEKPIGGLGVFLAKQNTDEFIYQRIGNKNRNILVVKHRPESENSN